MELFDDGETGFDESRCSMLEFEVEEDVEFCKLLKIASKSGSFFIDRSKG